MGRATLLFPFFMQNGRLHYQSHLGYFCGTQNPASQIGLTIMFITVISKQGHAPKRNLLLPYSMEMGCLFQYYAMVPPISTVCFLQFQLHIVNYGSKIFTARLYKQAVHV